MTEEKKIKMSFKVFRGTGEMPWDRLLLLAAEFANSLPWGDVLSICHSSDRGDGTVVVWYREALV